MAGLSRVLVLDFSKLLPGPFCSMALADLGCRVVRVELPYWKDMVREIPPKIEGTGFCYWMANRNKESLSLDFRKPEGRALAEKLVRRADVLIEGFRPGLMDRIGLGFKKLRRLNPRLIYCSITGYGQTGPLRDLAGHDLNFLAQSGFLGLGDSNGSYSFPPIQIADLSGGLYAATAVLGALLERERSGKGQHVDISLAESAFSWLLLPVGQALASGRAPELRRHWWNGGSPFYRIYETADGRRLAVAALERGFALNLLTQLGRPDLAEQLAPGMDNLPQSLHSDLEAIFRARTLADWLKAFEGKDVCVSPVLSIEEALRHPFLAERESLGKFGASAAAPFIRSPMRLSRSKFSVRRLPPELGKDTDSVLALLKKHRKPKSSNKRAE